MAPMIKLYRFQKQGVKDLIQGFKTEQIQCLAWYTGSGKMNIVTELAKHYIEENPRIKIGISAYLTTEIKDQVENRLLQNGIPASKIEKIESENIKLNARKNVYVFNPQGLYKRKEEIEFDLLIIEEAHAGTDEDCIMLRDIREKFCGPKTKLLIVSATPWDLLQIKEYQNIPVLKRPLDQGIKDGLVNDFKFHAEEAQITFKEEDFTRSGDLGRNVAERSMAILKSACVGKVSYLLDNYDKELGKKVLVICPPGNYGEVARTLAERFNGIAFLHNTYRPKRRVDLDALERFKNDENERFLFVINKCQVGFDMKTLSSVVDLTMTRNVKVLAQRCGRIARKNGDQTKHYFYVYDQSLMKNRLEWLIATMVDFCLGHYDGWSTKSAKYRKIKINRKKWHRKSDSLFLSEIAGALREANLIRNVETLSYVKDDQSGPPIKWNLELARAAAKKYSSRTEMWEKQPALYKWFRLNAKPTMDLIFPLKRRKNWIREDVVAAMNLCKTRKEFNTRFRSASDWLFVNDLTHLKDEHLPESKSKPFWNDKIVRQHLKTIEKWSEIRNIGNMRRFIQKTKGEKYWQKEWTKMTGRTVQGQSKKLSALTARPKFPSRKVQGNSHAKNRQ